MTHQCQRALGGPTSSRKVLEGSDEYSLILDIRGKVIEVRNTCNDLCFFALTFFSFKNQINTCVAMMALKIGAPKDYMQLLQEHADIVNLPRVGVD
jgi:hypothetical protein